MQDSGDCQQRNYTDGKITKIDILPNEECKYVKEDIALALSGEPRHKENIYDNIFNVLAAADKQKKEEEAGSYVPQSGSSKNTGVKYRGY